MSFFVLSDSLLFVTIGEITDCGNRNDCRIFFFIIEAVAQFEKINPIVEFAKNGMCSDEFSTIF